MNKKVILICVFMAVCIVIAVRVPQYLSDSRDDKPVALIETEAPTASPSATPMIKKELWTPFRNEVPGSSLNVGVLKRLSAGAQEELPRFEMTVAAGTGEKSLKLQKLLFGDKTIIIPQNFDDFPMQYIITPDGQKTLVAGDNGIWLVDGPDNQLQKLSADSFNGQSYEQLARESIDLYGENLVSWNGDVMPSPDSSKLAYYANKNNISDRGTSLFVYDFASGVETVVAHTEGANYLVDGWLDSEWIICKKYEDTGITQVAVHLDGKEIALTHEGEAIHAYTVQQGLIAYTKLHDQGEIFVARIDDPSTPQVIASFPVEGQVRERGKKGFSPDQTYFAAIYVPDASPEERYLKVLDLNALTVTVIDTLPDAVDSSATILDFAWTGESTLLVDVKEKASDSDQISTWIYALH